uniref:hypothetical protein n=1 Tax=Lachnospira sp. TaxID=2049031 RepID=UPI003FEDA31A
MICAKCGTEYEGSQCPKCEGPVIKVNNSDYLARRKAYEEKQARLKELEALKADSTDNDDTDKVSDNDNTSNKKNHTQKSKNYDEGVFDITKVDFGEVADKLKSEKDKIVASGNKLLKAVGEKAKNGKQIDKGGKNSDNINSSNNENVNISGNNDNNSNNINGKKRGNINNNRDKNKKRNNNKNNGNNKIYDNNSGINSNSNDNTDINNNKNNNKNDKNGNKNNNKNRNKSNNSNINKNNSHNQQNKKSATAKQKNNSSDDNRQDNGGISVSVRKADKANIPYTKAGIIIAAILVAVAAVVLIVNIAIKKDYNIYMSDGNKIYDVSSLDSKYVCDNNNAVFALDDVTFYTPEWPADIDRDNVILKVASPKGDYYAADVYNTESGNYTFYIWSEDVCKKVVENEYSHNVYYISDKGTVIYEETETINDNGKTGNKMLSMAEIKKDKSDASGYVCDVRTIERSLKQSYVYSDKNTIIVLNDDGRLYQYDYVKKTTTEVDMYVDDVAALSDTSGMYSSGAEHLNTSDDVESYMYSLSSGENYYVELKNVKTTLLRGITGTSLTYIYDKKNDYIYWISSKKISYAKFKNDEITDVDVLENTGTSVNVVYIPDKEELVYINDAAQLVKAEKGKKTFIADSLRDGSLSLIKNTDEMLTYIADGRQHYIKNTSSKPVEICEAENMVNTSNTSLYKKRLYFYAKDGQLYSCNLKGRAQNQIGSVERFFVGNKGK